MPDDQRVFSSPAPTPFYLYFTLGDDVLEVECAPAQLPTAVQLIANWHRAVQTRADAPAVAELERLTDTLAKDRTQLTHAVEAGAAAADLSQPSTD